MEGGNIMPYTWNANLESGNARVDAQHKSLISLVNDYEQALIKGANPSELIKALEFLVAYTVEHFSDEEQLQIENNYPDFNVHKKIHDEFKRQAVEMLNEYREQGFSDDFARDILIVVSEWLINHIKGMDLAMVAYINRKI